MQEKRLLQEERELPPRRFGFGAAKGRIKRKKRVGVAKSHRGGIRVENGRPLVELRHSQLYWQEAGKTRGKNARKKGYPGRGGIKLGKKRPPFTSPPRTKGGIQGKKGNGKKKGGQTVDEQHSSRSIKPEKT